MGTDWKGNCQSLSGGKGKSKMISFNFDSICECIYTYPKLTLGWCICGSIHRYSKQLNFGFKWEQLFSFSLEIEDALNFPFPLGESQNRSKTKRLEDIFQFWLMSGSSVSQINTQLLYTGDGAEWISEGNSAWDKELKQLMKVQSVKIFVIESIVYHMHISD